MYHGETVQSSGAETCADCSAPLALDVHLSAAGHYVGTACACGPYSRESGYYASEQEAREALTSGGYGRQTGLVER